MPEAEISGVQPLPPFTFRWPDAVEHFEGGWDYYLDLAGSRHRVLTAAPSHSRWAAGQCGSLRMTEPTR